MLTIVCLGVFIYSGSAIGLELFGYYQNRQVLAKAQTMYGHEQGMNESRGREPFVRHLMNCGR